MLVVGDTLSPRALFGRGFNSLNAHCTLYEADTPVAMVLNVNHRSPSLCRIDEVKSQFKHEPDWDVYVGSSITYGRGIEKWTFFLIVYRPGVVDLDELRRAKF